MSEPSRGRRASRAPRRAGLLLALTSVGAGAGAGSCAQPRPYTRMLVVIDTDLQRETDIDRIEFTTCPGDRADTCAVRAVLPLTEAARGAALPGHPTGPFTFPLSIALEPTQGDDAPTRLQLVGRRGADLEVSRRVIRTHFVHEQTVVVAVYLSRRCASLCPAIEANETRAVCHPGDDCGRGTVCPTPPAECSVPEDVTPRALPPDAGPDAEFGLVAPEAGADATEPAPEAGPDAPVADGSVDAADSAEAATGLDAMDVTDATDAMDVTDAMDAMDVTDAMDARDAVDEDARVVMPDGPPVDMAPPDVRDVVAVDMRPDAPDAMVCPGGMLAGCAESCVDPLRDPLNCGECDHRCQAPANAFGVCSMGRCIDGMFTCAPGFFDVQLEVDGCETDLRSDIANCGAGGNVCGGAPVGALPACIATGTSTPRCTTVCAQGNALTSGTPDMCAPTVPVLAPQSGAVLTGSRNVTFRWLTPTGVSGLQVQLCSGGVSIAGSCLGAMTTQNATMGSPHIAAPPLAPGTWNWRLAYTASGSATRYTPWREFFLVTPPTAAGSVNSVSGYRLDFDRDGRTDVVTLAARHPGFTDGEPFAGAPLSRAYVYLGRDAPAAGVRGTSVTPSATLVASTREVFFANTGAAVGDVNGDGYGDLATGGGDSFVVFAGGPGGPERAPYARVSVPSTSVTAVAPAGDVNQDGYGDIAVLFAEGILRIYYGGVRAPTQTGFMPLARPTGGPSFYAFASGFDANGDGYADLVASSDTTSAVYAWFSAGAPLTSSTAPVTIIRAGEPGSGAEDNVDAIASSDLNGDGYADLVLGYQLACAGTATGSECDHEGRAVVRFGAAGVSCLRTAVQLSRVPVPARDLLGAFFGSPIATGTDLNGDGYLDLAVGARLADQVQFFLGRAGIEGPAQSTSLDMAGPGRELNALALPATYGAGGAPMAVVWVRSDRDEGGLWYDVRGAMIELQDTMRRPGGVTPSTGGLPTGLQPIVY